MVGDDTELIRSPKWIWHASHHARSLYTTYIHRLNYRVPNGSGLISLYSIATNHGWVGRWKRWSPQTSVIGWTGLATQSLVDIIVMSEAEEEKEEVRVNDFEDMLTFLDIGIDNDDGDDDY